MLLNRNIILEIIRTFFSEQVEYQASKRVIEMCSYELEEIFGYPVDYAMLDTLGEMEIEEYSVADDGKTVKGVFEIEAFIEGYVYWDEESEYWDASETRLVFGFEFNAEDAKASGFKIYNI